MRAHLPLTLCAAFIAAACGSDAGIRDGTPADVITAEGILRGVEVLAADSMEGRGAATEGERRENPERRTGGDRTLPPSGLRHVQSTPTS